jgi:hypothetical protein
MARNRFLSTLWFVALLAPVLALGVLPACGDDDDDTDTTAGETADTGDTSADTSAGTTTGGTTTGGDDAQGDTGSDTDTGAADDAADTGDTTPAIDGSEIVSPKALRGYMVTKLEFIAEERGVSQGFDLDGRVTPRGDRQSCGQKDFTSPDGVPGVDNQLAKLLPAIELAGGDVIKDLLQNIINDGTLIILITMEGFDDETGTAPRRFHIQMGQGKPMAGTDGELLFGQSFGINTALPEAETNSLEWNPETRTITTGAFDLDLPATVLTVSFILDVKGARFQFEIGEDDTLKGFMGGAIPKKTVQQIVTDAQANDGGPIEQFVGSALQTTTDMNYDSKTGECTGLSAALSFEAIPVYVVEWPATATDQTGDTGGESDGATDAETTGE